LVRIKEFLLDPESKYSIKGTKYRHILDEGELIDEDNLLELVYVRGTHIAYDNLVWRIPSYFKDPKCIGTSICEKTDFVIVDILVGY